MLERSVVELLPSVRLGKEVIEEYVAHDLFILTLEALLQAELQDFLNSNEQRGSNGLLTREKDAFYEVNVRSDVGMIRIRAPRDQRHHFRPVITANRSFFEDRFENVISLAFRPRKERAEVLENLYGGSLDQSFLDLVEESLRETFAWFVSQPLADSYQALYLGSFTLNPDIDRKQSGVLKTANGPSEQIPTPKEYSATISAIGFCIAAGAAGEPELVSITHPLPEKQAGWQTMTRDIRDRGVKGFSCAFVDESPGLMGAIRDTFPFEAGISFYSFRGEGNRQTKRKSSGMLGSLLQFVRSSAPDLGKPKANGLIVALRSGQEMESESKQEFLSEVTPEQEQTPVPQENPCSVISETLIQNNAEAVKEVIELNQLLQEVGAVEELAIEDNEEQSDRIDEREVNHVGIAAQGISPKNRLVEPLGVCSLIIVVLALVIGVRALSKPTRLATSNYPAVLTTFNPPTVALDMKSIANEELVSVLLHPNIEREILISAIQEAGIRSHHGLARALYVLSSHQDFRIRVEVARILANPIYGNNQVGYEAIKSLLRDPEYLVRGFATKALVEIDSETSRALLFEHLQSEQSEIVRAAAEKN